MRKLQTFIFRDADAVPIDFWAMMSKAVNKFGMAQSDFWDMPFFMFVSLSEVNTTQEEKRRNRKYVVDSMRYTRQKFGWV